MTTKTAGLWTVLVALVVAAAAGAPMGANESSIRKLLADYRAAMEARSVGQLAAVVSDDLLILEGTHKNDGWADYRDNHIGPEMAEWKAFKAEGARLARLEVGANLAYAVQEATYTIVAAGGPVVMLGAETFVFRKTEKGWRITHVHLSGKRIGPARPE